ncbi:MAG: DUF362 domain-containing protein [Dehalococcoidales bacterium]|nr:DUF362 domain-containing protein [Dehalococcoidales bacterium]
MIYEASDFVFNAPPMLSTVRRVLIKPNASYSIPYPVTTSRDMMVTIIEGIRRVTDADILILEGTPEGDPIYSVYQSLGYDFPRVLTLDVKDCIWVEVDNPLPKPLAVPTFWVPNVILSSDYLITVAPLKIINGMGNLSLMNMLTVLPSGKYKHGGRGGWQALYNLGIDKVIADLYFTLSFDLGIIEARQKFTSYGDPVHGQIEEYGKVFIGEPYQVDCEASRALGLKMKHLNLIEEAKVGFEV